MHKGLQVTLVQFLWFHYDDVSEKEKKKKMAGYNCKLCTKELQFSFQRILENVIVT